LVRAIISADDPKQTLDEIDNQVVDLLVMLFISSRLIDFFGPKKNREKCSAT